MTSLVEKWTTKLGREKGHYESACYNGSFQGQVIAKERTELCEEAIADLTSLQQERDEALTTLRQRGVCMSCWRHPPEPYGCTDCLNTGWDGGMSPEHRAAQDQVDRLSKPITMQDVRLATGEGKLSAADVLAGCNAELVRRGRT